MSAEQIFFLNKYTKLGGNGRENIAAIHLAK